MYSGDNLFWTDSFSMLIEAAVEELKNSSIEEFVRVYPNPALEQLSLQFIGSFLSEIRIDIYESTGKMVYSSLLNEVPSSPLILDLSPYKPGLYFIRIMNKDFSLVQRITKVE